MSFLSSFCSRVYDRYATRLQYVCCVMLSFGDRHTRSQSFRARGERGGVLIIINYAPTVDWATKRIGPQRELRVLCDRGCGLEEHLMNMMIK